MHKYWYAVSFVIFLAVCYTSSEHQDHNAAFLAFAAIFYMLSAIYGRLGDIKK